MPISMTDLYSQDREAEKAEPVPDVAPTAAEAATISGRDATATNATAHTATMAPDAKVDEQLNRITSQDSSYIKGARQSGSMMAAARGLQNSSLAAGSAERAAVNAALPVAQQNAAQEFQQGQTNQAAENDMEKLNAQMQTAVSQGNAEEANKIATQIANLQTQTSMQNATEANRVNSINADRNATTNQFNANEQNKVSAAVFAQNAELNKQYLAGTQAMDLASIQGKYNLLISNNDTASKLYSSHFAYITEIMRDPKTTPAAAASKIAVSTKILNEGLAMIDSLNGIDLSSFTPGGGTATPPPASTAPPPPPPEPAPQPNDLSRPYLPFV
jgi:hypothetical protein